MQKTMLTMTLSLILFGACGGEPSPVDATETVDAQPLQGGASRH